MEKNCSFNSELSNVDLGEKEICKYYKYLMKRDNPGSRGDWVKSLTHPCRSDFALALINTVQKHLNVIQPTA